MIFEFDVSGLAVLQFPYVQLPMSFFHNLIGSVGAKEIKRRCNVTDIKTTNYVEKVPTVVYNYHSLVFLIKEFLEKIIGKDTEKQLRLLLHSLPSV